MRIRSVYSEHPEVTQWEMLMQYSYESNIKKELIRRGFSAPDNLAQTTAGAFSQAYEYFHASNASSLYTSPLLVYYGMANLLSGACQIMAGKMLKIENHGMKLKISEDQSSGHLAGVTVSPQANCTGALSVFGQILRPHLDIDRLGDWTLEELLGRIPDLYNEYSDFYAPSSPSLIPIERSTNGRIAVDRVGQDVLEKYPKLVETLTTIPDISSAYLDPQDVSMREHNIVLHQKPGGTDIALRAVSGSLFLCAAHGSAHARTVPTQEVLLYMALYALSVLGRYHPELWNPFVKIDFTGERHVFAKLVDIARRTFPNLILNQLLEYSVEFSPDRQKPEAIDI